MVVQQCAESVHKAVGDAGVRSFVSHHVQKEAAEPMGAVFVALLACRSALASCMDPPHQVVAMLRESGCDLAMGRADPRM